MRQDAIPRLSEKAINAHIDGLSRKPFRDMLKRLLQAEPSLEAVRQYGERCPDRYGQLVTMIAKLAGYHEKLEVNHSHAVAVSQMSDQELYGALDEAMNRHGQDGQSLALPSGGKPSNGQPVRAPRNGSAGRDEG